MQAKDIISSSILPLKLKDSADIALKIMQDLHVYNLPVVEKNKFLGLISENDIMNMKKDKLFVKDLLKTSKDIYIFEDQHLFNIVDYFDKHSLSVLPVLSRSKKYIGSITSSKILFTLAKSSAVRNNGGIIVLEMNEKDYSLSKISSITESNNINILSSYITSFSESKNIEVTLKLNSHNLDRLLKDFERFNYHVSASFNKENDLSNIEERYDSLMRYLNT